MFSVTDMIEQASFVERISEVGTLGTNNPRKLFELLKNNFEISTFIPQHFYTRYYSSTTNDRDYKLESILSALLLGSYFHLPTVPILVVLLTFSPEIRGFCHFDDDRIPDESVFSKFKTTYDKELLEFFNNLSSHVIGLFSEFNETLPDNSPHKDLCREAIYDTSGVKPKVKENNPKFAANEIKKQKAFKKILPAGNSFNPYAAAYSNMPKFANANPDIRLDYANGHLGYFYKFGKVTNGFGVPLHIHFLDEQFYKSLPNSFATPEEQKYAYDNASLKPVLSSFLNRVPCNTFDTFIGDSEFDSYANYDFLNQNGFKKMVIPINPRNSEQSEKVLFPLDSEFVPTCPKIGEPFIPVGLCKGKKRSQRLKFVCPKTKSVKGKFICECKNKCRKTNSTVTTYVYPNGNLRLFPGVQRGSPKWTSLYKRRSVIERSFSSFKSNPAVSAPNTYNLAVIRSNILLTAITKLITVILAFAVDKPAYMCSISNLYKAVA